MNQFSKRYQKFLVWGGRLVKTDLEYLLHGGFWLLLGQVTGIGTSLLLSIAYAHYLPKETYGTYKYILSIFGILSVFTMVGMDGAVQKGVARGREGIFWQALRYRLGGGLASALVAGVIGFYYFTKGEILLAKLFWVCSPFLSVMEPLGIFSSLLVGKKNFRASTMYVVLLQIGTSTAILASVLLSQNIVVLITAYVASNVLFRIILFILTVRMHPINRLPDDESLAFGKHWSAMAILGTLSSRLDAILLFHFLGPVSLAIYSFAQAATNNIRSSFKLVTDTLAFPKLAEQNKDLLKKTLLRKVYIAHAVTIPLACLAVLLIPFLYRFLFPTYTESILYAQVMTAFLAFSPLRLISTAINAQATPKSYYMLTLTGTILSSVSLLVFIPLWGIWGAVIAVTTQQSVSNVLALYLFKRM